MFVSLSVEDFIEVKVVNQKTKLYYVTDYQFVVAAFVFFFGAFFI